MANELTVKDEILIETPPSRVWEVLVNPTYVAQWDELPEDYPSDNMTAGSKVVWEHPNGDQTITTVIKAEENTELVIALYGSNWKN
ncbi:SRPBCC domain-containing protein [Atopococcus tabaci]|uniref:SRPBCC domain-containing protein n=1 Tax=Atopococcus tabaci TaxID=269774 RepID=UPI002408F567|nr:SRPBCC domain-containing protein [Atopococcus tabaci]